MTGESFQKYHWGHFWCSTNDRARKVEEAGGTLALPSSRDLRMDEAAPLTIRVRSGDLESLKVSVRRSR